MSFNQNRLATSYVDRIRLMVGDIYEFPLLEDSTYDYLYMINNMNEVDAAIQAAEIIINSLILNPTDESVGSVKQESLSVDKMQYILESLRQRKDLDAARVRKIPSIVKADKTGWTGFDLMYGKE